MFPPLVLSLLLGNSVQCHFDCVWIFLSSFQISVHEFVTPVRKLRLMSLASRMHFGFNFHGLAVDFVIITENAPRLGAKPNTIPSRSEYFMMIAYNNRRLSVACSSAHIGSQTRMSKSKGSGVPSPKGLQLVLYLP